MSLRCHFFSALVLLSGFASLSAQDLGRFSNLDAIAAQKLVKQVQADIADSRVLEKRSPQDAIQLLQGTQIKIQSASGLGADSRNVLMRQVTQRLAQLNELARAERVEKDLKALNTPKGPAFVPQGQTTPPKTSTDAIKNFTSAQREQLAKLEQTRILTALKANEVFAAAEKAAIPIVGDRELSPAWKQITEMRKEKIDPKELTVLKALNSTLSIDFNNAKFRDVIDFLQERTALNIFLHEGSLKENMIEYDDPVTLKVTKATVRSILRKVLGDKGLTYVIEEGSLQVMTVQKARDKMTVRVYGVDDLVNANIDPRINQFNPFLAQQMKAQNGLFLANMMMTTIDPTYWQPAGGNGTIVFEPLTNSLVVRASAEMHHMIGGIRGR